MLIIDINMNIKFREKKNNKLRVFTETWTSMSVVMTVIAKDDVEMNVPWILECCRSRVFSTSGNTVS